MRQIKKDKYCMIHLDEGSRGVKFMETESRAERCLPGASGGGARGLGV